MNDFLSASLDTKRVVKATLRTDRFFPDLLRGIFLKRIKERVYPQVFSVSELESIVITSDWELDKENDVFSGIKFFKAEIPGFSNVIDIDTLSSRSSIFLEDKQDSGLVSCWVSVERVGYDPRSIYGESTIVLGQKEGKEVIFDIHSGKPAIIPSRVFLGKGLHEKSISVLDALELGFTKAKVVW